MTRETQTRERREAWTCRRCYHEVRLQHDGLDADRIREHEKVQCPGDMDYPDLYEERW